MSRKKQSALVSVIEFARTAPVELVQEARGLIDMELRLRQPAPVVAAKQKRGRPDKRPSSMPPVNEATRIT